jgi:probable rRNA maturation factor
MNRVDISAAEVPLPAWSGNAEQFILSVLKKINKDNWDVSVLFCDDTYIKTLNKNYRHKDESTDVLSFPAGITINESDNEDGNGAEGERYIPGDIAISLDSLAANAACFGIGEDEELRRLLTHGLLHLDGMNHSINDIDEDTLAVEPMLALQEEILHALSGEQIMRKNQ